MTTSAYGSDRIEPQPDGSVALTCTVSKGWSARRPGAQTSAEHPGTAVRWDDGIFEVVEALPLADGGVRYLLAPWQDRHAMRVVEGYDSSTEAARASERVARGQSVRRRRRAILFAPLLGHLPGEVQRRMELEFGAPAVAMTVVSAVPLFVVGVLGSLSFLASAFGAPPLFPWAPPLLISAYLTLESAVRIGSAWFNDQPMGSIVGCVLHAVARGIGGGARSTAPRNRRDIPKAKSPSATPDLRAGHDRFRLLEPVLSLLSPAEQEFLERRYGFELLRWGRVSAAILFAVGAANALASLAALAGRLAGVVDVLWLLAGSALCVEQILRWRANARGRPRGSVLGVLVRPFARPLLAVDSL